MVESNFVTNKMKKLDISLLRVTTEFFPIKGGSVIHIIELTKNIQPFLMNQVIICPNYGDISKEFDAKFCVPVIRVKSKIINSNIFFKFPGVSTFNVIYYGWNVVKEIKLLNLKGNTIDIIQVHSAHLAQWITLLLKIYNIDLPVVIFQHSSPLETWNTSTRAKIMRKIRLILFKFLKPQYFIQLDDGQVDRMFMNKLSKLNINTRIVTHGIDTEYYKPTSKPILKKKFVILSTSRLDSFKRVDLTILSFKIFISAVNYNTDILLKIDGSGSLFNELRKLVKDEKLDNFVSFSGEVDSNKIKDDLSSADIVVGTSLISNRNRSIQEAMACEKPVVVFDYLKNNNLFLDMNNSMVVNPGDVKEFAERIRLLYENKDLRKYLGKNARRTIVLKRSWESRLSQELEVYEEIHLV